MKTAKGILIIYLLSCICFITSCGYLHFCGKYLIQNDKTIRKEIAIQAYIFKEYLEFNNLKNGSYPEAADEILEIKSEGALGSVVKHHYYKSDGETYILQLIINYKAQGCKNYTVLKIQNGAIYWKDNVARQDTEIDDIDWTEINYMIINLKFDKDGNSISDDPLNLPKLIE
jgi:hypothetical protein